MRKKMFMLFSYMVYHTYVLTTVASRFSRRVDFNNWYLMIIHHKFTQLTLTVKYEYISNYILIFDCLGGYRERETPGSIPNPEAKPLFADNTCPFRIGNVGRCLVDQFLLLFYYITSLFTITFYFFYSYSYFLTLD